MQITVNDVRNRLFRLFSPVINTPEFHEKYLSFSTLTDLQKRYDICEENWGLTMAYIHAIALHLDDKEFPSIANRTVPPEIVLLHILFIGKSRKNSFRPIKTASYLSRIPIRIS